MQIGAIRQRSGSERAERRVSGLLHIRLCCRILERQRANRGNLSSSAFFHQGSRGEFVKSRKGKSRAHRAGEQDVSSAIAHTQPEMNFN